MNHQSSALSVDSQPDTQCSVREVFGLDLDLMVPAFSKPSEHVPDLDPAYRF
ncbi:MAG: cobaltochelatase subunit CobS, partial [Pseudomonadota bacterium]|nr:cobaltochelatase subunit CobS [Pseudomonadota bacterium]